MGRTTSGSTAYTAARVYIHSREEILGFFGDLELLPPGIVPVHAAQRPR